VGWCAVWSRDDVNNRLGEDYADVCPDDGSTIRRQWCLLKCVHQMHVVDMLDRMCASDLPKDDLVTSTVPS
jgi:hypothetical protein